MDLGLAGRVALVTGASYGIGREVAVQLAREGATVAAAARTEAALDKLVGDLAAEGVRAHAYKADVRDGAAVRLLLGAVAREVGPIEVLVANAGGPPQGTARELDDEAWRAGFELTLMSAVRLARGAVPLMRERGYGRIINVTSLSVREPILNLTLSNAFRAGVTGFAKTLAAEVARDGITVNNVAPGYTETERLSEVVADDSARKKLLAAVPAGRFAAPSEIAAAVAFLASEQAGYITGQTLLVDGGAIKSLF